MPKSREFVESSDSDQESGATATSKKAKATDSSSKDHVSDSHEQYLSLFFLIRHFICISHRLNE